MTDRPQAPELPADLQVLDRPGPLQFAAALHGHVVAVLFWRLGCVHSRHALADLAALQQERLGRAFAALAIHAPAQAGERDLGRLRAGLAALPSPLLAAVDPDRTVMTAFGGDGYPTLVLVDAEGRIVFRGRGEPDRVRLAAAIDQLVMTAATSGAAPALPAWPVAFRVPPPTTALRRPQALALAAGELWIADTGNHRLIACDPASGAFVRAVGSGTAGHRDGAAAQAAFFSPAGLAVHRDRLLVCDTGNHRLRAVQLPTGEVTTVGGSGRRVRDLRGGGFGTLQGLSSPSAIAAADGAVWFAQAGTHQLWQFDPDTQAASAWLGTGVAGDTDGDETATFSQPSGLAVGARELWVADAGSGAVRAIDLGHSRAATIHRGCERPVAVAALGDAVLVADAWRGEVLLCERAEPPRRVLGAEHGLVEPSALLVHDDRVWVLDAGRGALFAARPGERDWLLQELPLGPLPPPAPPTPDPRLPRVLAPALLRAGADVTLLLALPVAAGAIVDPLQPVAVRVSNDSGDLLAVERQGVAAFAGDDLRIDHLALGMAGDGVLRLECRVTVRQGPAATPALTTFRFLLPVAARAGAALTASVAACD